MTVKLDNLLDNYRKRDTSLPVPENDVAYNEKVFDYSQNNGVTFQEADATMITQTLMDYHKGLEDSAFHIKADELIDIYDPSEPPDMKEGVKDPLLELGKFELKAAKESFKVLSRTLGYLYTPFDRGFKFAFNALMLDPFYKNSTYQVRKWAIETAAQREINFLTAGAVRYGTMTSEEAQEKIADINKQTVEALRQLNQEREEGDIPKAELSDFGKSLKDAGKALIPWPGAAKDVRSFGEIASDSYGRIVGREAPWYYAPLSDITMETTALIGLTKLANVVPKAKSAKDAVLAAKLTPDEISAIKKLHKQKALKQKVPIAGTGVSTKQQSLSAQEKLIAVIKQAKKRYPEKKALVHQDRIEKAKTLSKVQKRIRGEKLVSGTKRALSGQAPVPDFDPLTPFLTPEDIDTLFNMVNTFDFGGKPISKGAAVLSLDKLLHGKLIPPSERALLEQVFGKGLTKALFRKQSIASLAQDLSFEVINTPRALQASSDLSAAGRQGIIFSISHPIASTKAMGRSVRAAASLKYSEAINRVTWKTKWGRLADKFGVHQSPVGFTAKLHAKEELYMSRIAESLPFGVGKVVAASERAFTTFLNQQRYEVFKTQAQKWMRRGITPKKYPKVFQQYAKFVNHATGRGSLEQLRPGALTGLNAAFYSPRFQISRIQVMGDLVNPKTTFHARKAIARDLAEFYATGMGIMGMSKAGGAEVELDWRSSDFGKIKVGETRYNYWGAFQPLARLAGQVYSGEYKAVSTKKLKERGQYDTLVNFLRTKLSPVPGLVWDVSTGEDFEGNPVEPTKEYITQKTAKMLIPLFLQDSYDAWKYQGLNGQFPLSSGLAFIGIGVQTWELAPHAELELAKDELSRTTYGKNYDELSYIEAQMLDAEILAEHPGIVELEKEVKFEAEGVNFLKRQAQQMLKSRRYVEKHLDRGLLNLMNESKLKVQGVDRTFGNYLLNDEQHKEYQEKVVVEFNKLYGEFAPQLVRMKPESTIRYEMLARIQHSAHLIAANQMKIGELE